MRLGVLAGGLVLLALHPSAALAQEWRVEASAGRALYDPLAEKVSALNAALGVRYEGDTHRWAYLTGGMDLEDGGPSWGAAGLGGWLGVERGGLSVGAALGAELFGYGASTMEGAGGGATLRALPTLVLRRGAAEASAHAGLLQTAHHASEILVARTAFDAGGSVSLEPLPGLHLGAEGRYLRMEEGGYPYVGASARFAGGWGSVWAFGGRWTVEDPVLLPATGYGLGGSVWLPGEVALQASWQQEPGDPLYVSSARRTWSVRLSRVIGRPAAPAAPLPVVLPEPAEGRVSIRLPVSEYPESPSLLGDFTGWEPVPMVRAGELWVARVDVAPGVYHYGFRDVAGEWFVPASLPQTDDGMGGTSAVLVVP